MSKDSIFINRRHDTRRTEPDPCNDFPLDLYHRKRRKSSDRRNKDRTLADDYYAFVENAETFVELRGIRALEKNADIVEQ